MMKKRWLVAGGSEDADVEQNKQTTQVRQTKKTDVGQNKQRTRVQQINKQTDVGENKQTTQVRQIPAILLPAEQRPNHFVACNGNKNSQGSLLNVSLKKAS